MRSDGAASALAGPARLTPAAGDGPADCDKPATDSEAGGPKDTGAGASWAPATSRGSIHRRAVFGLGSFGAEQRAFSQEVVDVFPDKSVVVHDPFLDVPSAC